MKSTQQLLPSLLDRLIDDSLSLGMMLFGLLRGKTCAIASDVIWKIC